MFVQRGSFIGNARQRESDQRPQRSGCRHATLNARIARHGRRQTLLHRAHMYRVYPGQGWEQSSTSQPMRCARDSWDRFSLLYPHDLTRSRWSPGVRTLASSHEKDEDDRESPHQVGVASRQPPRNQQPVGQPAASSQRPLLPPGAWSPPCGSSRHRTQPRPVAPASLPAAAPNSVGV